MSTPNIAIEVNDVTEEFNRGAIKALGPVSLEFSEGEFLSIVGPSGCGKSTLLKIIGGLLKQTTGTVRIGDQEINGPHPAVGIAFQAPTLLPWRTVLRNVLLPLIINNDLNEETNARAHDLLRLVGLEAFVDNFPHQLSGGMQQRVAIARALVTNPRVLLMDEPFGALDEFTRETLNDELLRIWHAEKKTILFITHSIEEAVFLSDRIVIMSPRPGVIEDIIHVDLPRPRTRRMRQSSEMFELIKRVRGVLYPNLAEEEGSIGEDAPALAGIA
ncbi:ABC transporter ATP-binding protein [Castellaniella sp. WN]